MVEEVIRAKRFEVVDGAGRPRGNHWDAGRGVRADAAGPQRTERRRACGERRVGIDDAVAVRPARVAARVIGPGPGRDSQRLASTTWRGSRESQLASRRGTRPCSTLPAPTGRRGCPSTSTRRVCRASSSWTATGTTASRSAIDRRGTPHLEFFDADGRPVRE